MSERSRSRSRGRSGGGGTAQPIPYAQNRATEFPLRIVVSSEMVGAIIGRGGATIRGITQATRARVDVHRKENIGGVEKAITIYGNPDNCSSACKKILEVMSQEATNTNKGEISLKILAHNSLIGRIIGKAGTTIKKIMQETDTKINVSSVNEVSGLNIERVISIRGSVEGMAGAEALISSKLKTAYESDINALNPGGVGGMFGSLHPMAMMSSMVPPSRPNIPAPYGTPVPPPPPYPLLHPPSTQQQETETVQMYIPNNSVGAVIGSKGSYIRNIIRFSGATVKVATVTGEKSEQPSERQVTIIGTPDAQWKAQCMIFEKIREEGLGSPIEDPRLSVEISVPSGQVGRIIGKGGANVRELQRITGAVIKFPSASSQAEPSSSSSTTSTLNPSTSSPPTTTNTTTSTTAATSTPPTSTTSSSTTTATSLTNTTTSTTSATSNTTSGTVNSTSSPPTSLLPPPPSQSNTPPEFTSVHITGSLYSAQSAQRRIRAMLSPRNQ